MSWLENIRNKPQHVKLRIIWIVIAATTVLLIILWWLTSKITSDMPKDTTLFQTIGRGIRDVRDNFRK